jgi:hypothetical protein
MSRLNPANWEDGTVRMTIPLSAQTSIEGLGKELGIKMDFVPLEDPHSLQLEALVRSHQEAAQLGYRVAIILATDGQLFIPYP